jgi:LmbE family N-acetylglucosaminyl deacetylase
MDDDLISRPPRLPDVWRTPPPGRVLVLAPHPDDEVCGAGGALALHRLQGDEVHAVFLTDGTSGDPDHRHGQPSDVARMRRAEADAAAERLGGFAGLKFFGLPDGYEVNENDLNLVAGRLSALVRELDPGVVYVPWSGETHSDHHNTRLALERAFTLGLPRPRWLLEYEVWSPLCAQVILDITDVVSLKRSAIRAHESQVAYTDYGHHILGLNAHRALYLPHGRSHGEAFRVTRRA